MPSSTPSASSSTAIMSMTPQHRAALVAILLTTTFLLAHGSKNDTLLNPAIIIVLSIVLWATSWIPGWLTGLVFFSLCMVAHVAPAADIFAGFTSSATWLILSGLVIGASIQYTGLGDRLASGLAPRIGRSFARAILLVASFSIALAFAMPSSMGRVLLLLPILRALADHLGYAENSKGHRGIILAGVFGTFLPTFTILPSNIPNNVFVGTLETVLGLTPTFGTYLLLHFPVLGLLKLTILALLLIRLFHDEPSPTTYTTPTFSQHITPQEIHLSIVLGIAVTLWATDAWHGISAAWVGMPIAVWCLYPGSGLLGKNPSTALKVEPILYVAAIVSMGVLADQSGLGAWVAHHVVHLLPLDPQTPEINFGILAGLSSLMGFVVTMPGIPPIMTPLVPSLVHATDWSPLTIAMTQVVAFSTVILPYQAPPLIVAIQSGYTSTRDVTRTCLLMAAITLLVLWPLDYLWWMYLGMFSS
ncbi:SLC13 family permease [Desulfovibrio inopinatus]|uniref:SLC13 family permease n=1 Tax=Desulfovibrio inopinatus TaxID=102109 RepID=UPI000427F48B|nr:SLC13 family permease [Desulfovibrio inopinatus]